MLDLNLLSCFFIVLITIGFMLVFNQQHYWKILLFSSLVFYILFAGKGFFIILSLAIIVYFFGKKMNIIKSKWWLFGLILLPLLIKKIFYSEYQFDNFRSISFNASLLFRVIGLSYITFNALSYLIDIKRKYIEPESNFFKLLLYLLYFPIISSGPLTRTKYFFNGLENVQLKKTSIINGLRLILWGLFKNLVVANRLFALMNELILMELKGFYYLLVGFVFFLFLYCSFSSFINIFQGISLLFNISIKDNFRNRIYISASREEFWRGWHITLNQWFRDYFFYEIIKYDRKRRYTNLLLFITFICIALWHDFTLVFITWGIVNATWLIGERKIKKYFNKKKFTSRFFGVVYHTVLASFLASIFISKDIIKLLQTLFDFSPQTNSFQNLSTLNLTILIICFLIMDYFEHKTQNITIYEYLSRQSELYRYCFYMSFSLLLLFFALNLNMTNYYNLF